MTNRKEILMAYSKYRSGSFTNAVVADMRFEQYLRALAENGRIKDETKKAKAVKRPAADKEV